MSLQQISPEKRILFLKLFTAELINTSYQNEYLKQTIKTEKLRQRFIQPNLTPDIALKQTIKSKAFQPSRYSIQESEYPKTKPLPPHRTFHRIKIRPIPPSRPLKKSFLKKLKKIIRKQQPKTPPQTQALQQIQPEYQPKPVGFNLGKIELILRDPTLQSLECPGPGQNILVKKTNQISPTRMTLNQAEINNIINVFSQNAKIPITGGILKAAVGNLVISAVISEIVGSRFIINKISPPMKPQQQVQMQQAIQPRQPIQQM